MIHVVVGIIKNENGEILIAERPPHASSGGLWEFPGGKVEPEEKAFSALQREFKEEIGIHILSAEPWIQVAHDYGDRIVLLDNWLIKEFSGIPHGAEGQPIQWVLPRDFYQYSFPEGNREVISQLVSLQQNPA